VLTLPFKACDPLHAPLAVQLVALLLLQLSVLLDPLLMLAGVAVRLTAGGGTTVTVADWLALPPGPVQVSV
jgi:hypothetical protein